MCVNHVRYSVSSSLSFINGASLKLHFPSSCFHFLLHFELLFLTLEFSGSFSSSLKFTIFKLKLSLCFQQLLLSVGISILKILLCVARLHTVILGNLPNTKVYQNLNRYRETSRAPSFLILASESSIYFVNSRYIQERQIFGLKTSQRIAYDCVRSLSHYLAILPEFSHHGTMLRRCDYVTIISADWLSMLVKIS
ncbi:hypothetical protein HYC85_004317 [Camellia sinensis]|uniref:Uncharacterized protein n=1 Tax=Camellia sinensis TaxID=4442 RepID=A0A7J7HW74_CAMSI|nr:hypothetical protein HYC85_004317 [Camellia sinensis]